MGAGSRGGWYRPFASSQGQVRRIKCLFLVYRYTLYQERAYLQLISQRSKPVQRSDGWQYSVMSSSMLLVESDISTARTRISAISAQIPAISAQIPAMSAQIPAISAQIPAMSAQIPAKSAQQCQLGYQLD
eukprot:2169563-Rhodomonas_salina.6